MFSTCSGVAHSCTSNTCLDSQFFCYLSNQCLFFNQSCTCNSESSVPSAITACNDLGSVPTYTVVGQTQITVAQPGERFYKIPAGDIPVQEYDIVGIQVLQGQNPLKCENVPTGLDQQTVFKTTNTGWLEKNGYFPSFSTTDNMTCYFHTLYTKDSKQYFPVNLAYSSTTGDYDLSISIVEADSHNVSVLLEEAVADISWVYPVISVASSTSSSLGTVYTEWNKAYNFTVRVNRGTDLDSEWSFDSTRTVSFTDTCVPNVAAVVPDQCNASLYWSEKPYATFEYNTTSTGTTNLSVNFSNILGKTEKFLTIKTEKVISGVTFSLISATRISNNVAVNRVTQFDTSITDGTGVSYSFTVDGVTVPATNSSLFYTFTTVKTYMVEAIVSNIIGSLSDSLTVYAKQPANFQNCVFLHMPYVAAVGIAKNLTLQCASNFGAEVAVIWMLSDRSSNTTSATTTTSKTTQIWTQSFIFSSVQTGLQVTAFATDPFQEVATDVTIDIYNAIPSVDLTASSLQVYPSNSVTFTASVPALPGSYGNIVYSFDFGDGSASMTNTVGSAAHSFVLSGNYSVTVTASNGPSSETFTLHIEVFDMVTGLDMTYDGPKQVNQPVTFTASVTHGNFLTYRFTSSEFNISQSSGILTYTFTSAADYAVTVECFNALSEMNTSLTAYIMDVADIRLSPIKINGTQFNGCLESGVSYPFSVSVIHYDASQVKYTWNFDNSNILTGGPTQNQGYTMPGNYSVSVTAKYIAAASEDTVTLEVCVEELIVTPTIQISSPLGLPSSGSLTKDVTVTVVKGSNLLYSWSTNATAGSVTDAATFSVTFTSEGWYHITVEVSNNLNTVTQTVPVQIVAEVSGLTISCSTCTQKSGEFYIENTVAYEFTAAISSGTGVTYSWDFGDSSTGTGSAANHTYSAIGHYNITVTATNPVSTSFQQIVVVHVEVPITSVTLTNHLYDWKTLRIGVYLLDIVKTAVVKAEVKPDNMVITYDWVFDTGMTAITNMSNIGYHNYTTTGKKSCSVTVRNMLNSVTSDILEFYIVEQITDVNLTENGNFVSQSSNYIVALNTNYTFEATSSQIVEDTVLYLFILKLGAQLINSYTDFNFTKSFDSEGIFTLTFSVDYTINRYEAHYTIEAIKPIGGVYISHPPGADGNITLGSSFTLSCGALEGKYLQFNWFYSIAPAGEVIAGLTNTSNVTLTPGALGIYVVTAEVYNSVSPPQRVNYTLNVMVGVSGVSIDVALPFPDAVKQGTTLDFNAVVVQGTGLAYSWTATDAGTTVNTGTAQTFAVTFSSQALYNVTLYVENYASNGMAFQEIYSLYEVPVFVINVSGSTYLNSINKYVAASGNNINFTSSITNSDFITFDWLVNGSSSGSSEIFQTTFSTPSQYLVRLDAVNKISQESNELIVLVQDAISGLTVQFCQATFEVSTSVTLMANTVTGTDVSYKWEGSGQSSTTSNIHMVNFPTIGTYNINVTASNYVSQETEYCTLTILGRIGNLALSMSQYQFIMYPVTFTIAGDFIDPANFTWVFSHGVTQVTTIPTFDITFANQGSYTVTVTVANAVSNDTISLSFDVENLVCVVPTLTVDGSTERTTFRARPVEFAVTVTTAGCTNYTSVNKWRVYSGTSCAGALVNEYPLSSDIETSTPVLQLPGATLDYGTYCVTFTHRYASTPVSETKMFNLTIEESDLKALINGGDEFSAIEGSALTLDATGSYDPDNTTGTNLTYAWSCTQSMVGYYPF